MRNGRTLPHLAVIAALGVGVAACGGSSSDDTAAPTTDTQVEQAAEAPAAGSPDDAATSGDVDVPELLRFTAPLVGGGELDAATLADKPTAFWFWAPT